MRKIKILKVYTRCNSGYYNLVETHELKDASNWTEVTEEEYAILTNPKYIKAKNLGESYIVIEQLNKDIITLDAQKLVKQFQMEESALQAKEKERALKAQEVAKKARDTREKKKKEQAAKKIERARKILEAAGEL